MLRHERCNLNVWTARQQSPEPHFARGLHALAVFRRFAREARKCVFLLAAGCVWVEVVGLRRLANQTCSDKREGGCCWVENGNQPPSCLCQHAAFFATAFFSVMGASLMRHDGWDLLADFAGLASSGAKLPAGKTVWPTAQFVIGLPSQLAILKL